MLAALLGLGLAAALFSGTWRAAGEGAVRILREEGGWWFVAWAITIEAVVQSVRAARWTLVVRPVAPIRFSSAWLAVVAAAGATHTLPVRVDEAVRAWVLRFREGLPALSILGVAAADKLLDLVAVSLVTGLATAQAPLPPAMRAGGVALAGASIVGVLGIAILARHPAWVGRVPAPVRPLVEGALAVRNARWSRVVPLIAVEWGLTLLLYAFATHTFSVPSSFALVTALAVAQAGAYAVPHVPGAVGTYEAALMGAVLWLTPVAPERALAMALACHAVLGLPHMVVFLAVAADRLRRGAFGAK